MRRAYLHGFAGSSLSKKGLSLREAFEAAGLELLLPDLNAPSFAELSPRAMLGVLDTLDAERGDEQGWGFVGSSLGGWLAARWAEQHPARVARLVLLCPAFDLVGRWPELLPPGAVDKWQRDGSLLMPDGAGTPTRVHYRFYEESRAEPAWPSVPCETLIIHGTRDTTVPVEGSRRYAAERDNVELVEVDDVHDLLASQQLIVGRALDWLGEK